MIDRDCETDRKNEFKRNDIKLDGELVMKMNQRIFRYIILIFL